MSRRNLLQNPAFSPPQITSDNATSPPTANDVSPSIMITVLILAIAVILSASLYLLLRFLRRHRSPSHLPHSLSSSSSLPSRRQVSPLEKNPLLDTLPLFRFDSLAGKNTAAGDCAVCLSKFESKDTLRLLPVCCHAFHVECIDTWLNTNQTCPLCRSPAFPLENELTGKLVEHSSSFRVEIGHVSNSNSGEIRRSYSLGGSFDYIVPDDVVTEIPAGSFRRNSIDVKVDPTVDERGVLAGEVGTRGGSGGGGWLKDYLSHSLSSSRTASFRSSGRWFFTGSSRRTTVDLPVGNNESADYEASRLGEEIGELFRWLSGV